MTAPSLLTSAEEKIALAWLDDMSITESRLDIYPDECRAAARTLKAMLARPVMPESPALVALHAMADACAVYVHDPIPVMHNIYRALYAHLSKPKTKTEWQVTGSGRATAPYTHVLTANTEAEREAAVRALLSEGFGRITITSRMVPA